MGWKTPYTPILTSKELHECIVMNKIVSNINETKYQIALIKISKLSNNTSSRQSQFIKTHLFQSLQIGDEVLCYDMSSLNTSNLDFEFYKSSGYQIQNLIIVCKKNSSSFINDKNRPSLRLKNFNKFVNLENLIKNNSFDELKIKNEDFIQETYGDYNTNQYFVDFGTILQNLINFGYYIQQACNKY